MDRTERWKEDFLIKPILFLVGIYIAAILLQSFFEIESPQFAPIFTAAGGIPALGVYFKRKLNED